MELNVFIDNASDFILVSIFWITVALIDRHSLVEYEDAF